MKQDPLILDTFLPVISSPVVWSQNLRIQNSPNVQKVSASLPHWWRSTSNSGDNKSFNSYQGRGNHGNHVTRPMVAMSWCHFPLLQTSESLGTRLARNVFANAAQSPQLQDVRTGWSVTNDARCKAMWILCARAGMCMLFSVQSQAKQLIYSWKVKDVQRIGWCEKICTTNSHHQVALQVNGHPSQHRHHKQHRSAQNVDRWPDQNIDHRSQQKCPRMSFQRLYRSIKSDEQKIEKGWKRMKRVQNIPSIPSCCCNCGWEVGNPTTSSCDWSLWAVKTDRNRSAPHSSYKVEKVEW